MKKLIQHLLKITTSLVIKKYNPFIIAVTGSVGKTSTKDGIYTAFSDFFHIKKSFGNLNTEFGAPLVFLKVQKSGVTPKDWFLIILKGLLLLIKKDKSYPRIIIVELAADKPGDMDYFSNFIKPNISVVTAIGEIPVHIEFYKTPQEVANEKEKIIKALKNGGVAVLNCDDPYVSKMKTDKRTITFGFQKEADICIKNFKTESLDGSSITLSYMEKDFSFFLPSCIGDSFAYIAASIFAVGIALEIEPHKIPKMIEKIRPAKGRLVVLKGIKNTVILDGSYNASPSSTTSALKALQSIQGERKIAILGDMLELGKFSREEHKKIGRLAADVADVIIAIGAFSEEIRKTALQNKEGKNVFAFSDVNKALEAINSIVKEKDIVLVKGSQGIRTEKIVFSLMRDPERAEELLARQDNHWKKT
jgi:UDP-N-acetylmuramoyl-tripeptide--D-alanyl-D-alanine ligase